MKTPPLLGLAFALSCQAAPDERPAPDRPNVVVILADDLRWDAMGCAGHPFLKTELPPKAAQAVEKSGLEKK